MKLLLKFIFSIIGILLVSGLPILLSGLLGGELQLAEYFRTISAVLESMWPVQDISVFNYRIQKEMPVFPNILEYISYSLQILFLALGAAVFFALTFTVLTMLLGERARDRVKMVLYFLESLPDLLIIMLAQLAVIFFLEQTGILISSIAVTGANRIYWLPVSCLALLPMIQLYRLCMLTFQEEERQMYVELARSLGFSKTFIILVHMFRNAVISVFFQSKKTVWFMLSNLFVLELMFNLPGIMLFLRDNMMPQIFILTIFSFFLPIFFLYSIGEWFFLRRLRGKEVL
ncbi:ABC transporter permease subunit [Planomicrobium sp. CPCC 101079]|uniref:ABC transporter permease subunit n=1 Tax=Planomicrobium sp. CPCC 101079 TaxID=2599618 RepID=UPI002105664A|nr:ABC transporter permease subunit [Planomicrobium sp. CPCC 101079]